MGAIWEGVTADILAKAKFRGPVRYADGRNGMAQQDHECVDNPRFGYAWRRENRKDKGRIFYTVDGVEVGSLDEAARHLLREPDPASPRERMKALLSENPAERQQRHAEMNAEHFMRQGPFGMLMASYARSENAWHGGINRYSDILRERGEPFPRWLYAVKSGTFEMARVMRLFAADRDKDTGLKCALGKACRRCEILNTIEAAMEERRTRPSGMLPPRDIDDSDIDAALSSTASSSPAEAEALQAGVDVEALAKAASDEVLRSYKVLRAEELALTVSTAVKMRAKALTRALSSAPAQEDGSKDLGAHPRVSGQSASSVEAVLRRAVQAVTDATSSYLPPDGISKDELISRVLAATDNPEINAVMLGGRNGAP